MRILRILEMSWMVIAILGLLFGTYKWITETLNHAIFIYGISAVAALMYFMRRKQRMSMEKQSEKSS